MSWIKLAKAKESLRVEIQTLSNLRRAYLASMENRGYIAENSLPKDDGSKDITLNFVLSFDNEEDLYKEIRGLKPNLENLRKKLKDNFTVIRLYKRKTGE